LYAEKNKTAYKKIMITSRLEKFFDKFNPKKLFSRISDLRHQSYVDRTLGYSLEVVAKGLVSGISTLPALELFSESLGVRVPASTLKFHLRHTEAESLKKKVASSVKEAARAHKLTRGGPLPFHLTALDGKRIASSRSNTSAAAQKQEENRYEHNALRALCASSATPVFLGQQMIPGETGESTQVIPFVDELAVLYKHTTLLDVFSLDAGLSSQDNYTGIIERGYRCIARIKGNRGKIYDQIKDLFSDNDDPKHVTTETRNGKTVKRELWTSCETYELSWKDIAQAWYIRQTTTDHRTGTSDTIHKYYATNIKAGLLTCSQILAAVRNMWAIENKGFFNLDYSFVEDDFPLASHASEVTGLLRLLMFNHIMLYISRTTLGIKRVLTLKEVFQQLLMHWHIFMQRFPERQNAAFV
jgi:hypothetical protein